MNFDRLLNALQHTDYHQWMKKIQRFAGASKRN